MHSYPWYRGDWLGSEARASMTGEEKGLYRELLDHCWTEGSLPSDETQVRRVSGFEPEEFSRAWPRVRQEFKTQETNGVLRLVNPKVEAKRPQIVKAKQDRAGAARENGKKGGRPPKPKEPESETQETQGQNPRNLSSPSPSPSPSITDTHTQRARENPRNPRPRCNIGGGCTNERHCRETGVCISGVTPSPPPDVAFDGFDFEALVADLHTQHTEAGLGDGGGRVRTRHALSDQLPRILARQADKSADEVCQALRERHRAWCEFWQVERQRDRRAYVPFIGSWLSEESYRNLPAMPQGVSA